jgi:hypothetical protein
MTALVATVVFFSLSIWEVDIGTSSVVIAWSMESIAWQWCFKKDNSMILVVHAWRTRMRLLLSFHYQWEASMYSFTFFMSDRHLSSHHHRLQASFHDVSTSDRQPQALSSVHRLESNPLYIKKVKDKLHVQKVTFSLRTFDRATNAMRDDEMHTRHYQWDANSHSSSLHPVRGRCVVQAVMATTQFII